MLTSAKKKLQIFVQNKLLYKCAKFHDLEICQSKVTEGGADEAPPPPAMQSPKKPSLYRVKLGIMLACYQLNILPELYF